MAIEHAPAGKRGFYGSWPQIGVPAGLLLANLVFLQFAKMPQEDFLAWGWRVPFLISIVLVGVGLVIRLRILETPAFLKIKESRREAQQPIIEVLRRYPKQVLLAMGARLAENGAFYIYSVFVLVYATQHVHMMQSVVLYGMLLASTLELAAIPFFGGLSDRVGRRPVYLFGAIATAVLAYPLFRALDTGSTPLVWLMLILVFLLSHAAMYAPQAAFFSELFGTRVRYSGASLGVQLSSVLAGGLSPIIATRLLQYGYGRGALALYLIGMAAITIAAVIMAAETISQDIDRA
jgi:MFS family permease